MRDTILCPHSDHLSFLFSATACLIPYYSFFLSPSLRYKVTYSSNHNFLYYQRFFKKIISNSIPHNHSNSIHKPNYDWRRKIFRMNKYLLILFFFFMPFFLLFSLGAELFLLLFSLLFLLGAPPFFFSFLELSFSSFSLFFLGRCHSSFLFSMLDLSPSFSLGCVCVCVCVLHLFFLFLTFFSWFLFSGGLVFSLSPSVAWTSRSEIDSSLFLAYFSDRLRGTRSYHTHDTDMPSSCTKYVYM